MSESAPGATPSPPPKRFDREVEEMAAIARGIALAFRAARWHGSRGAPPQQVAIVSQMFMHHSLDRIGLGMNVWLTGDLHRALEKAAAEAGASGRRDFGPDPLNGWRPPGLA